MNIKEYKKAMSEVTINTDNTKEKIEHYIGQEKRPLLRYKKVMIACITAIAVLLAPTGIRIIGVETIPDITLTVQANSGEPNTLSEDPVLLTKNYKENMMVYSEFDNGYKTGSMNIDLNFKCEGKDIKTITYSLSDKEITRDNKNRFTAWFVENQTYPSDFQIDYKEDKSMYRAQYFDDITKVTKIIGSSYTVTYENQNNMPYGLEFNLTQDDAGNLKADKFTIRVIITFEDDVTVEKQILVQPTITEQSINSNWFQIKMHLIN
ncbi:MAG: hypothetical protein K0R21_368 [Anaerocolumna sp.]|jgi:hypothetical protein|nr:hypothetical protein [Anaerocolumna sp.]